MKKYISILFLIAFIVPSVAFASWWNPFSWKIFQKKEPAPQVQVETKTPEEKINELQKQLDGLKNQQPVSTSTTTPPPTETTKPTTNVNTIVDIPTPLVKVVDVCLNIEGIQSQIPSGYSSVSNICNLIMVEDFCPNIDGVQLKIPEGMFRYKNTYECLTDKEINAIEKLESQPTIAEQCKDIVLRIREQESIMREIELKYADLIASARLNPEGKFGGAVEQDIAALQRKKDLEIDPVEFERDIINQEYIWTCN